MCFYCEEWRTSVLADAWFAPGGRGLGKSVAIFQGGKKPHLLSHDGVLV
jgi:hypothetical protein